MLEKEQQNGGPQQNFPLAENENPDSMSNKEQGGGSSYQDTEISCRLAHIYIYVGEMVKECRAKPLEKGVTLTGRKVYRPPIPST